MQLLLTPCFLFLRIRTSVLFYGAAELASVEEQVHKTLLSLQSSTLLFWPWRPWAINYSDKRSSRSWDVCRNSYCRIMRETIHHLDALRFVDQRPSRAASSFFSILSFLEFREPLHIQIPLIYDLQTLPRILREQFFLRNHHLN